MAKQQKSSESKSTSSAKYTGLWKYQLFSTFFDYAWTGLYFWFVKMYTDDPCQNLTILSIAFVSHCWLRERINFWVFGDLVSKHKRDYTLSWRNWYFVLQTSVISVFNNHLFVRQGLYYWDTKNFFSLSNLFEVWFTFFILQLLKDAFSLLPFHEKMHNEYYWLHKTHHEVSRNAQSLMAFHIDILDLFIENACAPMFFVFGQWLLGYKMSMNLAAFTLVALMDMNIHSVNPYSVMLYNPILDYVFNCNVAHQIHHARNKDNYTFIPYHHLLPGRKQKDFDDYNKYMGTSFTY